MTESYTMLYEKIASDVREKAEGKGGVLKYEVATAEDALRIIQNHKAIIF
jgi:hypothetical protein